MIKSIILKLLVVFISASILAACQADMVLDYPNQDNFKEHLPANEEKDDNSDVKDNPSSDELLEGTVTKAIDGDTFDLKITSNQGYDSYDEFLGTEQRVRLILVNTPEVCHSHSDSSCKTEPYGDEAKQRTAELITGQTVYLERDQSTTDPYGRLLFYVYLEDGRMLQEILIQEGLAEVTPYPPDVRYEDKFKAIELETKGKNKGIWSR